MIKVARAELARGLKLAASIADRKSAMPMLACVLLRATVKDRRLRIAATDLTVSLTAELTCEVDESAAIVLKADDVSRFVGGASGAEVSIEVGDRNVAEIWCGRSKYRIAGYPDRDFPKVPRQGDDAVECDAAALREMLERGSYAVSLDETRGAIKGVHLEVGADDAKMASVDGHRMVRIERKARLPRPKDGHATVCARGAGELLRLLDGAETCTASIDARHLHVRVGAMTVSASLLDETYPPIDAVFPKEHKASAVINRDRLIESLKRVSPLASESRGVTITPHDGALTLVTADHDGQELTDEIEAELSGDKIAFSVNVKYTLDCLQHMTGDAVTMRLVDAFAPVVFLDHDDAGHTGIVMPMRTP
jgi:DNA polymerase-3 subunit beta